MTAKPSRRDSIIIAAGSILLGVASAQAMLRARKAQPVSETGAVVAGE